MLIPVELESATLVLLIARFKNGASLILKVSKLLADRVVRSRLSDSLLSS